MKIVYPGHMTGYHVIGKKGVRLTPGVNEVDATVGAALIAAEIAIDIEETHHRENPKPIDIGSIEPVEEEFELGRAEGGE